MQTKGKPSFTLNGVQAIAQTADGYLWVGTELGLFVSVDGGAQWGQFKGGLPNVAVRDLARTGRTVGKIYAAGSVGSIVGTIGTSFFLVPIMGSRAIFYLLAALTIGCAAALDTEYPAA